MTQPSGQYKTTNYMVPSNGQTHAVTFQGQFSATPLLIDWRQYAIDNELFQPQGVFVDNSAGTTPLVITILPIGYKITVGAGLTTATQFPAPNGQTATITGDPANTATVIFVDFPVLPSGLSAQITNTPNVNIASVANGVVMKVDPNPLAAGNTLPYRDQEYVPQAEYHYGSITGSGTSFSVTPTAANQNLRKLGIYVTGDAYNSGSAEILVTAKLNGNNVFERTIWLPTAAPTTTVPSFAVCDLDFGFIGLPAAAGALQVTISSALTGGVLDINAYFTPQ